jgi:uncharacterized damage-inducible protein DinB
MLEFLRKLFIYDKWAVSRSLSSLEQPENERARRLLAHILLGEKIWLTRLKGEDSSAIPTFEEFSFVECMAMSDEIRRAYEKYLDSLAEADLDSVITYKNTKGIEYQTSVKDILTHVGLHSVYHRGQIALLVRDDGGTAVDTDFITFTRL